MTQTTQLAPVTVRGTALHAILIPLGAALLGLAFLTDIAYVRTFSMQWETFSVWLITGGLIVALLSALALVVDIVTGRMRNLDWAKFGLFVVIVVLSIINAFVHSRDGYTSVMPSGILLSLAVAILLAVAGWRGWSLEALSRRPVR